MVCVVYVVNKYLRQMDKHKEINWDEFDVEEFEPVKSTDISSEDIHRYHNLYNSYLNHTKKDYINIVGPKFEYNIKYKHYQCQKCGENIGLLGRFIEWITFKTISHKCNKQF